MRPGTSEGLSKTRNEKIITLTDIDKARKLPMYDRPERLVYTTPATHRLFTKEKQVDNDETTFISTKQDNHFVFIRPKAFVPSTGYVWASETVMLRHNHPDIFESSTLVQTTYSRYFRSLCAKVHDYIFQYCDMSEKEDLTKVTSTLECPHRDYERWRAVHTLNNLKNALTQFHATTEATESEKTLLANRISPCLTAVFDPLQELISFLASLDQNFNCLVVMNAQILNSGQKILEMMKELQLPPVKPSWVQLTDVGPGVGVSNFAVRFRDAELVRLFNTDIRERCHRSRDDSGQNEAERTNSAIGDAVVDGSTIDWEVEKRFEGMTSEEIESMSLQEYDACENARMERNAWAVTAEVQRRVDDAPVLSEYITAYTSQRIDDVFLH